MLYLGTPPVCGKFAGEHQLFLVCVPVYGKFAGEHQIFLGMRTDLYYLKKPCIYNTYYDVIIIFSHVISVLVFYIVWLWMIVPMNEDIYCKKMENNCYL